ncbi:MAG: ArsB/NhaD family transporter [Thermomicrobiales bacterium]
MSEPGEGDSTSAPGDPLPAAPRTARRFRRQAAMTALLATTALLGVIVLIILQPRGLNEAWAAGGGAAACSSSASHPARPRHVTREVADVLLFLIGMMALTAAVERSASSTSGDPHSSRGARSGIALFVGIFLLGFAITALLSLDVTVIVLTPIVYALVIAWASSPSLPLVCLHRQQRLAPLPDQQPHQLARLRPARPQLHRLRDPHVPAPAGRAAVNIGLLVPSAATCRASTPTTSRAAR